MLSMIKLGCEKEPTDVSRETEDSQGSQPNFQRERERWYGPGPDRDRGDEDER